MSKSLATGKVWKDALPQIETMVTQTLEAIEQKLDASSVGQTFLSAESNGDYDGSLSAALQERLRGFDALGQRAADALSKLDAELAADEDRLRTQLNEMQSFRQSLVQWIEGLAPDHHRQPVAPASHREPDAPARSG